MLLDTTTTLKMTVSIVVVIHPNRKLCPYEKKHGSVSRYPSVLRSLSRMPLLSLTKRRGYVSDEKFNNSSNSNMNFRGFSAQMQ